jgi:hypothetical protein
VAAGAQRFQLVLGVDDVLCRAIEGLTRQRFGGSRLFDGGLRLSDFGIAFFRGLLSGFLRLLGLTSCSGFVPFTAFR